MVDKTKKKKTNRRQKNSPSQKTGEALTLGLHSVGKTLASFVSKLELLILQASQGLKVADIV